MPHATTYAPFFASQAVVPDSCRGLQGVFDPSTLLWRVRFVHNLMDLKYSYMAPDVRAAQHALEGKGRKVADARYGRPSRDLVC